MAGETKPEPIPRLRFFLKGLLLFQNHWFEVNDDTICRIDPEIDKNYIISELAKLLKKDKHSLAALSGIPELAHYDEPSDIEEDSD